MPTDLPPTYRPNLSASAQEPAFRKLGQSVAVLGCLTLICGLGSGVAAFCVAAGYRLATTILP